MDIKTIGGPICNQAISGGQIQSEEQLLTKAHIEFLWHVFVQIGNTWENVQYESSNLKSSWLEMIDAKANVAPSYIGEYVNAVYVINELIQMYGHDEAFHKLFLEYRLPDGPPTTRLAHTKVFVINEFIYMQVMASGFKHYGGVNYHGYVKGSRYRLHPQVRNYVPDTKTTH